MSLKKEITSKNGAKALYHRIESVKKSYGYIEVTVSSYADEAYRDSEKELSELVRESDSLIESSYILTGKGTLTDEETEILRKTEEKMERIQELSNPIFHLFQTSISLNLSDADEISFQQIYSRLKNESDIFRGAEDC